MYSRHSDEKEFGCEECGKRFKRKDKMKEHAKRMHSEEKKLKRRQQQEQIMKSEMNQVREQCLVEWMHPL